MSPEQSEAGWKRAHISEVKALMERHGLVIADIQESVDNQGMVIQLKPSILPAQGYKVAGE